MIPLPLGISEASSTPLPQVLDEFHQKYKFMEKNLMARRRKLKSQVPDIHTSLAMLKKLKAKNDEGEDTEAQFLLSDQVYAKAKGETLRGASITHALLNFRTATS